MGVFCVFFWRQESPRREDSAPTVLQRFQSVRADAKDFARRRARGNEGARKDRCGEVEGHEHQDGCGEERDEALRHGVFAKDDSQEDAGELLCLPEPVQSLVHLSRALERGGC